MEAAVAPREVHLQLTKHNVYRLAAAQIRNLMEAIIKEHHPRTILPFPTKKHRK
jgi:hypothetical protein